MSSVIPLFPDSILHSVRALWKTADHAGLLVPQFHSGHVLPAEPAHDHPVLGLLPESVPPQKAPYIVGHIKLFVMQI